MSPSATSRAAPLETSDLDGSAQRAHAPTPQRVSDELAWELVRDEWELLLSIGSGPTSATQAAQALNLAPAQVDKRVRRLLDKNLIRSSTAGEGFELVPAFYERREGMSSYLRDLVLRRLTDDRVTAAPLSARSKRQLGGKAALTSLIASAERTLFPEVVALANRPESERSERFSVFFAFSDMEHAPKRQARPAASQADGFRAELLEVLQAAATARSLDPNTRSSYLWVAEMRTDPEVAQEISDLLERFVDSLGPASATASEPGDGALAFAVLPNQTSRPASPSGPTPNVGIQ
jgi:DNA-binding Lrp family transcriptional regulator